MAKKLIILEAGDSSGKKTQAELLFQRLKKDKAVRKIEFPNYQSNSSALVKMYLRGEMGTHADDVNPYAASTFYAVDRFASFKKDWEKDYHALDCIVSDRYTTSNMLHQAAKINDPKEWEQYLDWLWNLEFVKMGLPVPDAVIFLDMPPEFSLKLLSEREEMKSQDVKKDIHEKDADFLIRSYQNALKVAEKYHWHRIQCVKEGRIRSIEDIHQEILEYTQLIIDPS